jgi:uncharacterized protein YjbI with pentapeptide repeats
VGANLRGARLERTLLAGADMSKALAGPLPIRGRTDWPTNLVFARMAKARLAGAELVRAQLGRADLSGADLRGADLSGALMTETVLSGANLRHTRLEGCDLSTCVGYAASGKVPA